MPEGHERRYPSRLSWSEPRWAKILRTMPRNSSLQRRLTLMMLALLVVTGGAVFIVSYQIDRQILIDQIKQRALLMGKTLQLNLV